ncbi:Adenylate kinase/UMP-CMP kinase [Carpediemonas membranifera]|uniref:Adenylate kinase/UMP-CMP kinase n=1 Tax=Carpediemonas membranifera TaxID=201153 RepID=A0A8J6EAG7_9EUKA|nr:Adenylate kinase/UMP-CMP kinase [Carpediemonas membranifera]|eukprot:KAG9394675.1 Adenylate kinase/UMP-CMP kinase [Carpediemonas membranifera]
MASEPKQTIKDYLEKANVFQILHTAVKDLTLAHPDDPLQFLSSWFANKNPPRVLIITGEDDSADQIGVDIAQKFNVAPLWLKDIKESAPTATRAELAEKVITKLSAMKEGYVLTGFPQTRSQAFMLQDHGVIPTHVIITQGAQLDAFRPLYPKALCFPADTAAAVAFVGAGQVPDVRPEATHRVFLFGPPGSGVSTVATRLTEEPGIEAALTMQQVLYAEVAACTEAGRKLHPYTKRHINHRGEVDFDVDIATISSRGHDALIAEIAAARLGRTQGWVVHGKWPMNMNQVKLLGKHGATPTRVIMLAVPDEVCIDRLVNRRVDPLRGVMVHPDDPEWDERCLEFIQRPEDELSTVQERMAAYHRWPLLAHVNNTAEIVDGVGSREEVLARVLAVLRRPAIGGGGLV